MILIDDEALSGLPDWAVAAIWAADERIQRFAEEEGIDAGPWVSLARAGLSGSDAWAYLKMMGVTGKEVILMTSAQVIFGAIPIVRESMSDAHRKAFFVALLLSASLLPTAELSASEVARLGAKALHGRPGGNWDKSAAIRAAWATGKYTSRDICAEQECAAIGMSFSSARKALRGTPAPT